MKSKTLSKTLGLTRPRPRKMSEDALAAAPKAVTKEADAYAAAIERLRDARRAREAAEGEIRLAEDRDREAAVAAIRSGKSDPGTPETEKAKNALEAARRDVKIAEDVLGAQECDLLAAVVSNYESWREGMESARDAMIAEYDAQIAGALHAATAGYNIAAAMLWLDRVVAQADLQDFSPGRPRVRLRGIQQDLVAHLVELRDHGLFAREETDLERFERAIPAMRGIK